MLHAAVITGVKIALPGKLTSRLVLESVATHKKKIQFIPLSRQWLHMQLMQMVSESPDKN